MLAVTATRQASTSLPSLGSRTQNPTSLRQISRRRWRRSRCLLFAREKFIGESAPPEQPFAPAPSDNYWNHEAAVNDQPVVAGDPNSLFGDSAPPPALKEYFERIPTLPPPNRQALSDIPFLMPPPPSASGQFFRTGYARRECGYRGRSGAESSREIAAAAARASIAGRQTAG